MFAPRPYKASGTFFMSLSLIYDEIYIYNIYVYTIFHNDFDDKMPVN